MIIFGKLLNGIWDNLRMFWLKN